MKFITVQSRIILSRLTHLAKNEYVAQFLSRMHRLMRRRTVTKLAWWQRGLAKHGYTWQVGTRVLVALVIGVMIGGTLAPIASYFYQQSRYRVSDTTAKLVGASVPRLAQQITYDTKKDLYQFNKDGVTSSSLPAQNQHSTAGTPTSKKSATFAVDLPTTMGQGITYHETNAQLSFRLIPQFGASAAKKVGGRLVYPLDSGAQAIYTLKGNGLKEDIVLPEASRDEMRFHYTLDLPKTLTAKLLENGAIGIYSVDPALLGNISYSTPGDQTAVEQARVNGEKNHLLFELPAPVIKVLTGSVHQAKAHFELNGDKLSLVALRLKGLTGPISIDPSVIVTSSSDFQSGGNNESMIDTTSNPGQINRGGLTGGTVGGWTTNTDTGTTVPPNNYTATVAYNGFLYIAIGGGNLIYAAQIQSNGSLGAWSASSSFAGGRLYPGIAAYNGYLYIYGGDSGSTLYGDVQYAQIASNGGLSTFTTSTNAMAAPTCRFGYTASNGYLYAIGGNTIAASNCANGSTPSTVVQFAPLLANGDVGAWTSSAQTFATARMSPGTVAYNGYLYVTQGTVNGAGVLTDTQYAPIQSNGDVGTWITSPNPITTGHYRFGISVNNGYIYTVGGSGGSSTSDTWYTQINANGSIQPWQTTTSFNTGRWGLQSTVYNGYVYLTGGTSVGGSVSTTEYAKIDPAGQMGVFANTYSSFVTARSLACVASYNGTLYVVGGSTSDDGNNNLATTYSTNLHADNGNVSGWFASTSLPEARGSTGCTAYNGYIYVLGGYTGSSVGSALVRYAPLNPDGSIGSWVTTATSLPTAVQRPGVFVYASSTGTYLYSLGGNGASNTITYTTLNLATGAPGATWTTNSNSMTQSIAYRGFAQVGRYLYGLGGGPSGSSSALVEYAIIAEDGSVGTWNSTASMNTAIAYGNGTSVNGCIYELGGETSAGTSLSTTQYACPNADGTISTWYTGTPMNIAKTDSGVTSYNGYVYAAGGYTTTAVTATSFTNVNNGGGGGTLPWTTNGTNLATPYPSGIAYAKSFASGGYIYLVGGYDGSSSQSAVYSAPIASAGTVGSWTAQASMNAGRYSFGLAVVNGYIYVAGGIRTGLGYTATVESAQISPGGTLSSWVTSNSITTSRHQLGMTAWNGYLYIAGGDNGSSLGDVQYASAVNGVVGTWTSLTGTSSFVTSRSSPGVVAANGYLYVIGGTTGSAILNDAQYAPLNTNGSITAGSWKYTTAMPLFERYMQATVYNGFIYVMGASSNVPGSGGGVSINRLMQVPIRGDGNLGNWTYSPTMQADSHYQLATAIYNGIFYRLGGFDGTLYYKDVDYAPLTVMTRVGQYSKLLDLGGAENVSGLSFNPTTFPGNISLNYLPADGTGVFGNVASASSITSNGCISTTSGLNSARWLELNVVLDDTLTAVFPDTAGQATNVTDITVNYIQGHPNPNIRLRTGQSLIAGGLDPLDTCQP
jgi:N-acetylneuraminic acid mutarotase